MRKPKRWIHPVHGKGYKSPQFDGALGPLTDKKIERYILMGHYGEAARVKLEAEMKLRKRKLSAVDVVKQMIKLLSRK